jgi:hypothetical protein
MNTDMALSTTPNVVLGPQQRIGISSIIFKKNNTNKVHPAEENDQRNSFQKRDSQFRCGQYDRHCDA